MDFYAKGADGSVRMFDLRHLEHSTIIYEDPQHHPLLRLAWNKQDPNYLATMAMDASEASIKNEKRLTYEINSFILKCLPNLGDYFRCEGTMYSGGEAE